MLLRGQWGVEGGGAVLPSHHPSGVREEEDRKLDGMGESLEWHRWPPAWQVGRLGEMPMEETECRSQMGEAGELWGLTCRGLLWGLLVPSTPGLGGDGGPA